MKILYLTFKDLCLFLLVLFLSKLKLYDKTSGFLKPGSDQRKNSDLSGSKKLHIIIIILMLRFLLLNIKIVQSP